MKKEAVALLVTTLFGLTVAIVGFAVRYSIINLSHRMRPDGYRFEGMITGLFGFILFAYAAIRLASNPGK